MAQQDIPQHPKTLKTLRLHGKVMIGLLVIQYVIGMVLDFFIKLPDTHPGMTGGSHLGRLWDGFAWALSDGGPALASHVGTATLLVLAALATLGFAIVGRNKTWIIASSFGLLGVVSALLNGIEFINTDLDKHSFAMAIAFMIALLSYGAGLYATKQKTTAASR